VSDSASNMELMQTLDDAWNAQDWDTFTKRHKSDTVVSWPGKPPTHGADAHRLESIEMFRTFPDNRVGNRPYKVLFGAGEACNESLFRACGAATRPQCEQRGAPAPVAMP
jgi:SnoaL-like polyketide cyclase